MAKVPIFWKLGKERIVEDKVSPNEEKAGNPPWEVGGEVLPIFT